MTIIVFPGTRFADSPEDILSRVLRSLRKERAMRSLCLQWPGMWDICLRLSAYMTDAFPCRDDSMPLLGCCFKRGLGRAKRRKPGEASDRRTFIAILRGFLEPAPAILLYVALDEDCGETWDPIGDGSFLDWMRGRRNISIVRARHHPPRPDMERSLRISVAGRILSKHDVDYIGGIEEVAP